MLDPWLCLSGLTCSFYQRRLLELKRGASDFFLVHTLIVARVNAYRTIHRGEKHPTFSYVPFTLLFCARYPGHYARTGLGKDPGKSEEDRPVLLQAVDQNKDQTYFLCGVPGSALAKVNGNGDGSGNGSGNGIGNGNSIGNGNGSGSGNGGGTINSTGAGNGISNDNSDGT